MNALPQSSWLLTVEEYLAFEEQSDVRHEYVGGEIFAMVGASLRHATIVGNVFGLLWSALRGTPCQTFSNDVKLQVAEDVIYYPDVVLTCDPEDLGPYIVKNPVFVAEILSRSSSGVDRREKARSYLQLPSLLSYLIVHQDEKRVDFYWRGTRDDDWHFDVRFDGSIGVPGTDLRLALDDIFEGVDFDSSSGSTGASGGGSAASI
jgi:Uma2 family endonuclease